MNTLAPSRVTDSSCLCLRLIYTPGCLCPISLSDKAATAATEERGEVFNCGSSSGHSSSLVAPQRGYGGNGPRRALKIDHGQ